ncbi:MAG TPA: hypothetical protein VGO01_01320 [Bradyrhizobium sp.]|nr:hypothetical protein [Bradyrhizobium sp.]
MTGSVKQSRDVEQRLDCFVAPLLATTRIASLAVPLILQGANLLLGQRERQKASVGECYLSFLIAAIMMTLISAAVAAMKAIITE